MAAQLLINEQRLFESIADRKRTDLSVQCYGGQTVIYVEDVQRFAKKLHVFIHPSQQIVIISL